MVLTLRSAVAPLAAMMAMTTEKPSNNFFEMLRSLRLIIMLIPQRKIRSRRHECGVMN
jgi:hypothetical protein